MFNSLNKTIYEVWLYYLQHREGQQVWNIQLEHSPTTPALFATVSPPEILCQLTDCK